MKILVNEAHEILIPNLIPLKDPTKTGITIEYRGLTSHKLFDGVNYIYEEINISEDFLLELLEEGLLKHHENGRIRITENTKRKIFSIQDEVTKKEYGVLIDMLLNAILKPIKK